jgi:hypothetical protein
MYLNAAVSAVEVPYMVRIVNGMAWVEGDRADEAICTKRGSTQLPRELKYKHGESRGEESESSLSTQS